MHRKHADALVQRGEIRLGTLHDYRNMERHGPMIGDDDEGKKFLFDNVGMATGDTLSRTSPFAARLAAQGMGPLAQAPGVAFVACTFRERHHSPNCWLFCMSAILSARVMRSFKKGYDACVRIDYYHAFHGVVGEELARQGLVASNPHWTPGEIFWCEYKERTQHYLRDDRLPAVMLKAPVYAEQQEVRFAYWPLKPITEDHRMLTLRDLADCCTLLEDIPE